MIYLMTIMKSQIILWLKESNISNKFYIQNSLPERQEAGGGWGQGWKAWICFSQENPWYQSFYVDNDTWIWFREITVEVRWGTRSIYFWVILQTGCQANIVTTKLIRQYMTDTDIILN